jgi:hypothetical protein
MWLIFNHNKVAEPYVFDFFPSSALERELTGIPPRILFILNLVSFPPDGLSFPNFKKER